MVGHTHEDVDQMFSRFNEGLRAYRGLMYTLSEFITTLEESFTPKPSVFFMYGVRDWKTWLDTGSSHAYANMPLHGQCRPHQFKFLYTFASDKHAEMKYKRWARDEEWFPLLTDTLRVFLLQEALSMSTLQPKRRRWVSEIDYKVICNTFQICHQFFRVNDDKKDAKIEEMVGILQRMQGMVEANQFVRPSDDWFDPSIDVVMVERKKWKPTITEGESKGEENQLPPQITQEDVDTDDEDLVYQGKLHSADTSYVTNKKNYVDISELKSGNFVILRVVCDSEFFVGEEDSTIALAKVLSTNMDTKKLEVHWYGDKKNGYTGKQNPLMKANPKSRQGKKSKAKGKNIPYTDTQDYDSILVCDKVKLTRAGKIPKSKLKQAIRRLEVVKLLEAKNKEGPSSTLPSRVTV